MERQHCVYFDYWGQGTKVTVSSGKFKNIACLLFVVLSFLIDLFTVLGANVTYNLNLDIWPENSYSLFSFELIIVAKEKKNLCK